MLVDMHAHVIPGALDAVGASADHRGPRIGPCAGNEHARLLENDRGMQFKAIDAFYSAERRLEELERSGVDAEVVSPMPPLLD
jgi:aminocarboxymuconate-semialdehyde decarboxylase